MIRYIGISPVTITDQEDYQGKGTITNSSCNKKLLTEAIQADFKEMNDKGLAEYLSNYYMDNPEKIISIFVEIDGDNAKTTITAAEELTEEEIGKVKNYIEGQFSDGWGEGFEQMAFEEFWDEIEDSYYDEEEERTIYETERVRNGWCASFWSCDDNWNLKIVKEEDYQPETIKSKPRCKLTGEDGNVFNIIGIVRKALNDAGLKEQAKEFSEKAFKQKSYNDVLNLCSDYVDVY